MKELTFEKANGNGQSRCIICKVIAWDCFMYKVKELKDKRVCGPCKKAYEERHM